MLIIKKCSVTPLRAALVTPFRIATGQHDTLDNLLFSVVLENGIKGYGEAAVATHITGETLSLTAAHLREAGAVLSGEDMSDPVTLLRGLREPLAGNHAALAAVEMAVLDAFTRAMKVPLWSLFGSRPAVLTSDVTIVIGTVEEAVAAAKDWYSRGFRTFKIKIGKDPDLDVQRLVAVRKAAPRAKVLLDANQGFTAASMLRFLKTIRAKGVRPLLLEQPVPRADVDGLRKLTRLSGVPVCADESAGSLASVTDLLKKDTVNAINVKLMKSGILESADIVRLARAKGAQVMIGAMMESALAITAAAHMAAGLGGCDHVDLDTTFFIKGPLSRSPYLDAKGVFDCRQASAGIGVVPRVDRA